MCAYVRKCERKREHSHDSQAFHVLHDSVHINPYLNALTASEIVLQQGWEEKGRKKVH